uniref:Uncharacterized protein n=1 Tax=Corethron hystrix TaxID=216773 RepID=A0A7S1BNP2_9STRA
MQAEARASAAEDVAVSLRKDLEEAGAQQLEAECRAKGAMELVEALQDDIDLARSDAEAKVKEAKDGMAKMEQDLVALQNTHAKLQESTTREERLLLREEELSAKVVELEDSLTAEKNKLVEFQTWVEKAQVFITQLQTENDGLKDSQQATGARLVALEEEHTRDCIGLKQERDAAIAKRDDLQTKVEQSMVEQAEFQAKLKEVEARHAKEAWEAQEALQVIAKKSVALANREKELEEVRAKVTEGKKREEEQARQLEEFSAWCTQAQATMDVMQEQKTALDEITVLLQADGAELVEEEISEGGVKGRLQTVLDELQELQRGAKSHASAKDEADKLRVQVEQLTATRDAGAARIDELDAQVRELEERADVAKTRLDLAEAESNKQCLEEYVHWAAGAQSRLEELEEQNSKLEERAQEWKVVRMAQEERLVELEAQAKQKETLCTILEEDKTALQAQVKSLQAEQQKSVARMEFHQVEAEKAVAQASKIQGSLRAAEERAEAEQARVEELAQRLEEYVAWSDNAHLKIAELEAEAGKEVPEAKEEEVTEGMEAEDVLRRAQYTLAAEQERTADLTRQLTELSEWSAIAHARITELEVRRADGEAKPMLEALEAAETSNASEALEGLEERASKSAEATEANEELLRVRELLEQKMVKSTELLQTIQDVRQEAETYRKRVVELEGTNTSLQQQLFLTQELEAPDAHEAELGQRQEEYATRSTEARAKLARVEERNTLLEHDLAKQISSEDGSNTELEAIRQELGVERATSRNYIWQLEEYADRIATTQNRIVELEEALALEHHAWGDRDLSKTVEGPAARQNPTKVALSISMDYESLRQRLSAMETLNRELRQQLAEAKVEIVAGEKEEDAPPAVAEGLKDDLEEKLQQTGDELHKKNLEYDNLGQQREEYVDWCETANDRIAELEGYAANQDAGLMVLDMAKMKDTDKRTSQLEKKKATVAELIAQLTNMNVQKRDAEFKIVEYQREVAALREELVTLQTRTGPDAASSPVGEEEGPNLTLTAPPPPEDELGQTREALAAEMAKSQDLYDQLGEYAAWCETAQARIHELEEEAGVAAVGGGKPPGVKGERSASSTMDLGANFTEEALCEAKQETVQLQDTIRNLEETLAVEQLQAKDLRQQIQELAIRSKEARCRIVTLQEAKEKDLETITSLRNSLEANLVERANMNPTDDELRSLETALKDTQALLELEKAASAGFSQQLEDVCQGDEYIQRELDEVRREKVELKNHIQKLKVKVVELQSRAEASEERVHALVLEKEGLVMDKDRMQELTSLLETERQKTEDMSKTLEDYSTWCTSAQTRIREMEAGQMTDSTKIQELQRQMDKSTEGKGQISDLQQQIQDLSQWSIEARTKMSALEEEKEIHLGQIQSMDSLLNSSKEKHQSHLDKLECQLEGRQADVASLLSQKENQKQLHQATEKALQEQTQSVQELSRRLEDLCTDDDFIQSELDALRKEKVDMMETNERLQRKIDTLVAEVSKMEECTAAAESRAQALTEEVEVQHSSADDCAKELLVQLESKRAQAAELSSRLDDFSAWCASAQERMEEMEREKGVDRRTIEELEARLDEEGKRAGDVVVMRSKLQDMEAAWQKVSTKNQDLQKKMEVAQKEHGEACQLLHMSLDKHKHDADKAISLWEARCSALNERMILNSEEFNAALTDKKTLNEKMRATTEELKKEQERCLKLEKDVELMRQVIDGMREEFNEFSNDMQYPFNETDAVSAKATEMATQALRLQIAQLRSNFRNERDALVAEREYRESADQEILCLKEKIDLLSKSSMGVKDLQEQILKARSDAEEGIRADLSTEITKLHQQMDHVMNELELAQSQEKEAQELSSASQHKVQITERDLSSLRSDWQYLSESSKQSKERQSMETLALRHKINMLEKDYEGLNRMRLDEIRSLKSELANTLMERDRALISVAEAAAKAAFFGKHTNTKSSEADVEALKAERAKLLCIISETRATCERRIRESVVACTSAKDSDLIVEREARKKADTLVCDLQGQLDEAQRTMWELKDSQVQKRNDDNEVSLDRKNEISGLHRQLQDMTFQSEKLIEDNNKLEEKIRVVHDESHMATMRLTDKCQRSEQRIMELEIACKENQVLAERRKLQTESLKAEFEALQMGYSQDKKLSEEIVNIDEDDFCVLTAEEMTDQVAELKKAIREDRECYQQLLMEHEHLLSLVAQQDVEISCLKESLASEVGQDVLNNTLKKAEANALSLFGDVVCVENTAI